MISEQREFRERMRKLNAYSRKSLFAFGIFTACCAMNILLGCFAFLRAVYHLKNAIPVSIFSMAVTAVSVTAMLVSLGVFIGSARADLARSESANNG